MRQRPLVKRLLNGARERAKKRGLPFALVESDIVVPTHCPVLGIELRHGSPSDKWSSPFLDRIVPSLGYVPGNVRVISWRANLLKNNSTLEELSRVVEDLRRLRVAPSEQREVA